MSWRRSAVPHVRVVLQKLDIESVQAAGGSDIESVFGDLLDGRDAGKRQEEAEMVGKILVGASDGFATRQLLGLEIHPSVARMNFAFALAVAGLSFSAVRVFVTCPALHVAI